MKVTVENVKANPEQAVLKLATILKPRCWNESGKIAIQIGESEFVFDNWGDDLSDDFNFIHEAEKQVIEKVGAQVYGLEICWLTTGINPEEITLRNFAKMITADAPTRLTACLLALGITELEEK